MKKNRIVLHFPPRLIDKPITYYLVKDYNLVFNILQAKIMPNEEGIMVLELNGSDKDYDKGIKFIREQGIKVQELTRDVKRNESKCTHCGVCVAICPTGALYTDQKTSKVIFDNAKCIGCELCVPACPPRAMEVKF
ncbi:MAG: 4Fe-4S dicluster domain-containing protein [Candidatus Omnitrophica bacterium]|nr:4Fe-4S dicluster domain-containing protein [Candidatus Omnitrophota bacterium]